MPLFIKSDKDPEGNTIRVDAGFRGKGGKHYLLLHRLPPHYPKPPSFMAELSTDTIELRSGSKSELYYKAYAIQDFSPKEIKFLCDATAGNDQLPFFNFSYPTIIRRLGKTFYKLSDKELVTLVESDRVWKLVGGQR